MSCDQFTAIFPSWTSPAVRKGRIGTDKRPRLQAKLSADWCRKTGAMPTPKEHQLFSVGTT